MTLSFLSINILKSFKVNMFADYLHSMKVKVKVTQPCPALCDPMDYTAHGNPQARILEWVDFPFSRGSSQYRDRTGYLTLQADFFFFN